MINITHPSVSKYIMIKNEGVSILIKQYKISYSGGAIIGKDFVAMLRTGANEKEFTHKLILWHKSYNSQSHYNADLLINGLYNLGHNCIISNLNYIEFCDLIKPMIGKESHKEFLRVIKYYIKDEERKLLRVNKEIERLKDMEE